MGYTDIFSLEPVDEDLRPYNLKSRVFKEFKDMKKREREMYGEAVDVNDEQAKLEGKNDDISVDFDAEIKEFEKKEVIDGGKQFYG